MRLGRCSCGLLLAVAAFGAEPLIQDRSHQSLALGEERKFRIFLPPDYGETAKRYPVIYWFHGWGERFNRPGESGNYDTAGYNGDTIAGYVASHDVIVVKWDGFNPRNANDEAYKRPYNVSPVETHRQFPFYFPELAAYIDESYRTIADRNHRATSGFSMGGFMSLWIAGKYPEMVSSASAFMPSTEFFAGYRGQDSEYRHEEMRANYAGVRTRVITGTRDFIRYYHRRLNAVWKSALPLYETAAYDWEHGTPAIGDTFDFHLKAFENPLPRPAEFSHVDVYPNFAVWGWEVASDRRRSGLTAIENVSKTGFRSVVREWLPGGRTQPEVKLTVISDRFYAPGVAHPVTVVRLRDGKLTRRDVTADGEGRLSIEVDGDANEVGIGVGAIVALARVEIDEAAPVARRPVKARAVFINKGTTASAPIELTWKAAGGVSVTPAEARVPALGPGAKAEVAVTVTSFDESREVIVIEAGPYRAEIPVFPSVKPLTKFKIVDGGTAQVFQHAVERTELTLGSGNRDGRVTPGESFAVLVADGDGWRALELFSNDRCLDLSQRISDLWGNFDHVGASAKYTIAKAVAGCGSRKPLRMIGRVQMPGADKTDHRLEAYSIELILGAKLTKNN